MTETPGQPADWYPDSQVPGGWRYWDGSAWTEHRKAPAGAQAAPSAAAAADTPATPAVPAAPTPDQLVLAADEAPKKGMGKGAMIGIGLGALLVVIIGIAALSSGGKSPSTDASSSQTPTAAATEDATPSDPPAASDTPTPSDTPEPSDTPTPAAPVAAVSGDGTFLVPSDVKPGTYTAPDASSGCYWERDKNTAGDLDSILANENANGPTVVTILKTDKAFQSNNCGDWVAGTPKIVEDVTKIDDGTWAVRVNVAPGTYKVSGVSGCYWARLKDFTGGLNSIIANDNVDGRAVVTISKKDVGFTSTNCGTWKRS